MHASGTARLTVFGRAAGVMAPIPIGRQAFVPQVRTCKGRVFHVRFRPGPLRLELESTTEVHFELKGSDLREHFGPGTEFAILDADSNTIGRGTVIAADIYASSPWRDNLRWAVPGSIVALVLLTSYTHWGRVGALFAVLLFVVGPVVALTIVALRHARSNRPKPPAA